MAKKQEREFLEDAEFKAQPDFVVCWMFAADGRLIGQYDLPNNKDKLDVHLPPNATLKPPPAREDGKHPYLINGRWEMRNKPEPKPFVPPDDNVLQISRPVLQKKSVADPANPGKTIESFEWVSEQITPESEAERSRARHEAFLAQQRIWGLEK